MTFSSFQKIQVLLVLSIVRFVYLVDLLTGRFFESVFIKTAKVFTIFVSVIFVAGVIYSFMTGSLQQISEGYLSTFAYTQQSDVDVLGAKSVRKILPVLMVKNPPPEITAKSVLIYDKGNKKTLYEKNSSQRLASASTTKLMTALIAMDIYKLDDEVTIPENCVELDSTKAGLPAGTTYRVKDLLTAMLVASSGDAACALAQGKVKTDEFLFDMNRKANALGMNTTFFTNPVGLDGDNSSHFSSAQDLKKLSDAAMSSDVIRQIVRTKEFTIKSTDESFIGKLETTNVLLKEIPQTIGIKTGRTTEAGEVLIYEYKDDVKDLLIIVMGSEDRFSDVRALLTWLLVSYSWV